MLWHLPLLLLRSFAFLCFISISASRPVIETSP
jgi:hypothetical protein